MDELRGWFWFFTLCLIVFVLVQLWGIFKTWRRNRKEERKIDLIVNPERADERQILTHVLDATRKSESALEQ